MAMRADEYSRELQFRQPAGTSRGVYTTRRIGYIALTDEATGRWGVGEMAPLPDLGHRDAARQFALETAGRHMEAGSLRLWDTPFSRGEAGIPINGLVWMGTLDEMSRRVEEKLNAGYHCVKVKIGAIDFEHEVGLLRQVRERFDEGEVQLRLDANGAFTPAEAMEKLKRLSDFGIHSIEQPIRQGQWQEMARLCAHSPIPIALDEELIGQQDNRNRLLDEIRPQYIVLKPTLLGGLAQSGAWRRAAAERGIGSWVTSALESNIGLNAIAQWCATLNADMPQGLGTGQLFTSNAPTPLYIKGEHLWYDAAMPEPDLMAWLRS